MASKNLKRIGKAAALLGTAYAASKMLGAGKENAAIKKGLEVTKSKPFGMSDDAAMARMARQDAAIQKGLAITRSKPFEMSDDAAPTGMFGKIKNLFGRFKGTEDTSNFGPMAKEGKFIKASKGTMVLAKTKLGRTKPTKLY